MKKSKYAGEAMQSFFDCVAVIKATGKLELRVERERKLEAELIEAYSEEGPNWKRGNRLISDMHASQTDSPIGEAWIGFERYAEDITSGVRLGVFFDFEGNLIGRQYFDLGDVPTEDVRKHLGGWDSLIERGRKRKQSLLPMSDEEIYDRIRSRREWYEYGPEGKEYEPTILDAAQQLAASMELADSADDTEIDLLTERILRAYERVKKRKGNK